MPAIVEELLLLRVRLLAGEAGTFVVGEMGVGGPRDSLSSFSDS